MAKRAAKPNDTAAARGQARAAHFAAGGDLRAWRGRAAVFNDRRKEADRRAARGRVRTDQY